MNQSLGPLIKLGARICAIAIGVALSSCSALVISQCGGGDSHAWRRIDAPNDHDRLLEIATKDYRWERVPSHLRWFAEPTGLRMLCASDNEDFGVWWIFDGTHIASAASWIHWEE